MKPSRTYTIAIFGIFAELVLAFIVGFIAWKAPEVLAAAGETISTIALAIGGASGAGAGARGARANGRGGRTRSPGALVAGGRGPPRSVACSWAR